jgi:simple sugar transport system ATP-binding protein
MSRRPIIQMIGIEKIYPDGQYALRGVDFEVFEGEIHGILGENGAGKTTLMRILYGEIRPTRGRIFVRGREVRFSGPWDAIREGIGMVYQHFSLIPSFTVRENLYLSMLSMNKKIRREDVDEIAREYGEMIGFKISLDEVVEDLPIGVQQKIEILKTLMRGARILILDEPTSVLSPLETVELFKILRRLKESGYTIIYITHKLREIKGLTDRVTIMRRGRVVSVVETDKVSEEELAKMMIGSEEFVFKRSEVKREEKTEKRRILEIRGVSVVDDKGVEKVREVYLEIFNGEILGLAGVQGNGQKELAEAIAGIKKVSKGRIFFNGLDITDLDVRERYRLGISYVPDSRGEALIYNMNLAENFILTSLERYMNSLKIIDWRRVRKDLLKAVERFDIKTRSLDLDVRFLSGGNQQKLIIAREFSRDPRLLIVSEPTHGLDIMSTIYVRDLLRKFRDSGRGVLLISSDLDEIYELSDRIAVINRGRIVITGDPKELPPEKIGYYIGI